MKQPETLLDSLGFQTVYGNSNMRIFVTIFVILISTYMINASVLDPVIENVVHLKASTPPSGVPGIWKKKTIWKPRWVKEWKSAKVMKPVWRKVWSPVQIREWVPVPKPPPGWDSISTPLTQVRQKPQKSLLQDSEGHDSFMMHSSSSAVPLWDPVPYPQSQQPPPLSFPQPLQNTDIFCGKGGCDNSPSYTFNHQQISEIIGLRHQTPENFQNPEYSETVNHLTRLPPDRNNWMPPQPLSDFRFSNSFNNFPELPDFLIPPKFQSLPKNDFPIQLTNNYNPTLVNVPVPVNHSSKFEIQKNLHQKIPLSTDKKITGHFITEATDEPYKVQFPKAEFHAKNSTNNVQIDSLRNLAGNLKEKPSFPIQNTSSSLHPQANNDFIQEAQLVGEFHYSEFNLPNFKTYSNKPQTKLEEKEQDKTKPQPKINKTEHEDVRKPKVKEQFVMENKQLQSRKEIKQTEVHNAQDNKHVQRKHIPNSSSNLSNFSHKFQQQEAIIREIFPVYEPHRSVNTIPSSNQNSSTNNENQKKGQSFNHSLTKLTSAVPNSRFNSSAVNFIIQQQEKIFQNKEIPEDINRIVIPFNHRFSSSLELKYQQKPPPVTYNSTKLEALASDKDTKSSKFENPTSGKTNSVQLVFATTPDDYNHPLENLQKTTTTESYEIIFSSSLLSSTETVTKSPVIIITPANSKKS